MILYWNMPFTSQIYSPRTVMIEMEGDVFLKRMSLLYQ